MPLTFTDWATIYTSFTNSDAVLKYCSYIPAGVYLPADGCPPATLTKDKPLTAKQKIARKRK